jgi:hypothetical protein
MVDVILLRLRLLPQQKHQLTNKPIQMSNNSLKKKEKQCILKKQFKRPTNIKLQINNLFPKQLGINSNNRN